MSSRYIHTGLPTQRSTNTQTFLETCVFNADHKSLEKHLVSNLVHQSSLNRCLLFGLQIVQRKERELSQMAQTLTMLLQFDAKWTSDFTRLTKTPYHIICEVPGDHHKLLKLMIKSSHRFLINAQDIHRCTALLYAVRHANINCLKCLIAKGADVNIESANYNCVVEGVATQQWCPIMEAIKKLGKSYKHTTVNVHADIFDLLLHSGAAVNRHRSSNYDYGHSPIFIAVALQNVYCIKKLIMYGTCLDAMDYNPNYVWSIIAKMGNVELLKCMVDHGIDKDITDVNGDSLLWHVLASDNVEAVRYLLDIGVTVPTDTQSVQETQCKRCGEDTLVIVDDETPSHPLSRDTYMRAIRYNTLEIVKLFEEEGSKSYKSCNTLRYAVTHRRIDVISYLLNTYTYPLNMEYNTGIFTIFNSRVQSSYHQGITLLTDPYITDRTGSKFHQITKLLLDHGADPAKPMCSETSSNAIMTAIHNGHLDVIAQYIRSGVDTNVRSYDCRYGQILPFEASVRLGYYNIARMFLISGSSCGVFSLDNNHKFKNNLKSKVKKLMNEWKVQENNVTPLKQRCRNVILHQMSPRANIKIEKLPLPELLIKFLNFYELDGIIDRYKAKLGHL